MIKDSTFTFLFVVGLGFSIYFVGGFSPASKIERECAEQKLVLNERHAEMEARKEYYYQQRHDLARYDAGLKKYRAMGPLPKVEEKAEEAPAKAEPEEPRVPMRPAVPPTRNIPEGWFVVPGYISYENGDGAYWATVFIESRGYGPDGGITRQTATDEFGHFSIALPPGSYSLSTEKIHYQPTTTTFTLLDDGTILNYLGQAVSELRIRLTKW